MIIIIIQLKTKMKTKIIPYIKTKGEIYPLISTIKQIQIIVILSMTKK